ncbi:hypothetical protein SAMN04515647_3715 [Cohaesibacter sp. ES.047]|uniref:hypothetical protein n=1 Tax=Cohaesibacter sp. ES.047 TaxID=1798205 RepID=UPI000BB86283|nr:hypothetical protein [Cohaesibacter sp. ES.047]SNY93420.1 hypothetical protein SAMN04515647_3715 [Cohaesibacter sp. ES.047]
MLTKTLLRMLTVQMLMEIPSLKTNVEDSLIAPLDDGKDARKWPDVMASVYTENLDRDFGGQRKPIVDLAIDLLAGVQDSFTTPDGEVVVIPERMNAKAELMCDLVEDDIDAHMRSISGEWAELWRSFADFSGPVRSYCGVDAKGHKRSLRRIVMPMSVYPSPVRGGALVGVWADVVSKFESDGLEQYKAIATLMRKVFEGTGNLADWVRGIEQIGLDRSSAIILGLDSREDYNRTQALVPIRVKEITGSLGVSMDGLVTETAPPEE